MAWNEKNRTEQNMTGMGSVLARLWKWTAHAVTILLRVAEPHAVTILSRVAIFFCCFGFLFERFCLSIFLICFNFGVFKLKIFINPALATQFYIWNMNSHIQRHIHTRQAYIYHLRFTGRNSAMSKKWHRRGARNTIGPNPRTCVNAQELYLMQIALHF